MLLAIDIGNTNISFGVFRNNNLVKKFNIPIKSYNYDNLKTSLAKTNIDACIICQVVPAVSIVIEKDIKTIFGIKAYVTGKNIAVPIKNAYKNPKALGQDRLVNAYGAQMFYKTPLIVIDFGTAITFDVVSRRKEYSGGALLPGLSLALDALSQKTARLPKIKLDKPRELIGRDTKSCMLSGVVYGFAALTDGLIEKIRRKIGKKAKVIGTGGNAILMNKYCTKIDKVDINLTLKALNLIYNINSKFS